MSELIRGRAWDATAIRAVSRSTSLLRRRPIRRATWVDPRWQVEYRRR